MRTDLLLHALAGLIIALIACFLTSNFWIGWLMATLAGAGKELIYDLWWKRGTPDKDDAFATIWGGLAGAVVWLVVVNVMI
jgi:heme O synthase-like polyprenyltransferase